MLNHIETFLQSKVLFNECEWGIFCLHALAALWFIGQGQGGHTVFCVKMRHRNCVSVSKVKVDPCFCLTSSPPGPPEVGKSVSKEGMAGQSDRRTGRPQVTPFSKCILYIYLYLSLSLFIYLSHCIMSFVAPNRKAQFWPK